jgi:hypothetical protein
MTILNIKKGDAPKTAATIEKAKVRYMNAQGWPEHWRSEAMNAAILNDTTHPLYQEAMTALLDFKARIVETNTINTFNAHLAQYRKAAARLARYRLADGRPEVYEDQPTGEYDDEGNEVMASVLVQSAIDPLPAQVEENVYDDEGNITGTIMVDNPEIVRDDEERAAAQAIIDATPQDVKDFD